MSGINAFAVAVETEPEIRHRLAKVLASSGFDVETTDSVDAVLKIIRRRSPSIMLIDWLLPDQSALHLGHRLRDDPRTASIPLVLMTPERHFADHFSSLVSGPVEVIIKPFRTSELTVRVRKLLERCAPQYRKDVIEVGGVQINTTEYTVSIDGKACYLYPSEFKLLRLLMSQPRQVFSRNQIVHLIHDGQLSVQQRTIDVSVRRLRMALGKRGRSLVQSVHGVGYRFSDI